MLPPTAGRRSPRWNSSCGENTAAAAQAENARKQAEAEIETHRKELESLGASTSDVTRQREEASQKLSDNRMQKLRTEKDLSLHEAALENLKGRSGEAEARVRELQANVAAAKERIAANELRANEIKRASEENKQKITAAEETIRKANAERMEKEATVTRLTQENRTLTDERERMSGEMARLAERKTAAETELNTTASKLWEEYQLTEAEAEKALCTLCQCGRPAPPGGRSARQDPRTGQRECGRDRRVQGS